MALNDSLEQKHYDTFVDTKKLRDVIPSTRIARQFSIVNALRNVKNVGILVDVGCGIAPTALYMDGKFTKFIGIDLSPEMIRVGREMTRDIKNVELIAKNIKDVELAEKADTVFLNGALHHMTELDQVVASLISLAKPGAMFVAREPQNGNPIIQILRWIRKKIDKSYSEDQVFFSESDLESLLKRHGFSDISFRYQGFISTPFAQVPLNPQWLFRWFSKISVFLETCFFEKICIGFFKKLSWDFVVSARFPQKNL